MSISAGAPAKACHDFLTGGGEMARVIAAKDWSETPLGPIEQWPQSLRTTVSLCLASNFPISLCWGPERVQIYNDGYWPICGAKHPDSMGQDFRDCWASAWPAIGEAFECAENGETRYLENQRMFLDRNGYLEETFFTFSFSPIRDEDGVQGLFHPVTETTAQMLSERRTRVLRDLASRHQNSVSVETACAALFETLADCDLDIPFALLCLPDEAAKDCLPPDRRALPRISTRPDCRGRSRRDYPRRWPRASRRSRTTSSGCSKSAQPALTPNNLRNASSCRSRELPAMSGRAC